MTSFWSLFGDDPAGIDCPPVLEQTDGAIVAPEDANIREPATETPGPTRGRRGRLTNFVTQGDKDIFE